MTKETSSLTPEVNNQKGVFCETPSRSKNNNGLNRILEESPVGESESEI